MSTPRAFANGGVIAAGGSGPGGERNHCLIMCGGYDEVPHTRAWVRCDEQEQSVATAVPDLWNRTGRAPSHKHRGCADAYC